MNAPDFSTKRPNAQFPPLCQVCPAGTVISRLHGAPSAGPRIEGIRVLCVRGSGMPRHMGSQRSRMAQIKSSTRLCNHVLCGIARLGRKPPVCLPGLGDGEWVSVMVGSCLPLRSGRVWGSLPTVSSTVLLSLLSFPASHLPLSFQHFPLFSQLPSSLEHLLAHFP